MSKNIISICVCSSGVRESLAYCLESLEAQFCPQDALLNIVLIDNSQHGDAKKFINPGLKYPLHYIHEPSPGIPIARNVALKQALELNSGWIAFIDDDEIAPPQWISRLFELAKVNAADVVEGGVVRIKTLQGAVEMARDHQPETNIGNLPRVKTAVTSNVLFSTKLILPPFSLTFDENMVFGGSDREFFMRAVLAGVKIVSADKEPVYEMWPVERTAPYYTLTRWFRYGVSFNYRYRKNHSFVKGLSFILLMFLYKLAGAPVKLLVLPFRMVKDKRAIYRTPATTIADIAYAFGCIAPFFGISLNRYY
jgi:succinoglycan biosynthesis protein ExoM